MLSYTESNSIVMGICNCYPAGGTYGLVSGFVMEMVGALLIRFINSSGGIPYFNAYDGGAHFTSPAASPIPLNHRTLMTGTADEQQHIFILMAFRWVQFLRRYIYWILSSRYSY